MVVRKGRTRPGLSSVHVRQLWGELPQKRPKNHILLANIRSGKGCCVDLIVLVEPQIVLMQQSPLTLRQQLIDAVDERYHVKDMAAIVAVLGTLERLPVTKEMLETTRLGRTVNEFRKQINNDKLAKRAKALVRKWREAVLEPPVAADAQPSSRSLNGNSSVLDGPGPGGGPSLEQPVSSIPPLSSLASPQGYDSTSSSPNLPSSSSRKWREAVLEPAAADAQPSSRSLNGNSSVPDGPGPGGGPSLEQPVSSIHSLSSLTNLQGYDSTSSSPNLTSSSSRIWQETVTVIEPATADPQPSSMSLNGNSSVPDGPGPGGGPSLEAEQPASSIHPLSSLASLQGYDSTSSSPNLTSSSSKVSPLESQNSNSLSPRILTALNSNLPAVVEPEVKKGRKRKHVEDNSREAMLHQHIAKARQEGKMRTIERLSREALEDELSQASDTQVEDEFWNEPIKVLNTQDLGIKNEIVEKYLKSQQTEIKFQIERKKLNAAAAAKNALDAKADQDSSLKTKKKKAKKKEESSGDQAPVFPSESEILARLPPIDPQILADFEGFAYFYEPERKDQKETEPKSEEETDINTNLNSLNKSTSLSSSDAQQQQQINTKNILSTKIDWGDSDDDEDFEEVKLPENSPPGADPMEVEVDKQVISESPIPIISQVEPAITITPNKSDLSSTLEIPPELPLREVDESEIERLHTEQINNLNGNMDKDGKFREWQETVTVESFNRDLLHILPYTIIDF